MLESDGRRRALLPPTTKRDARVIVGKWNADRARFLVVGLPCVMEEL